MSIVELNRHIIVHCFMLFSPIIEWLFLNFWRFKILWRI